MLKARLLHALSVGVVAGLTAYAEHHDPVAALGAFAIVAGLSGGSGQAIRHYLAGRPNGNGGRIEERIWEIERSTYRLTSLVTALKLEVDLLKRDTATKGE